MIYFFYGTDHSKIKESFDKLLASLLKKRNDATVVRISDENYEANPLQSLIESQSLFGGNYIVVLFKQFINEDIKNDFLTYIKEINESKNLFLVVEEYLSSADLKKIEKNSEKVVEYNEKEKNEIQRFQIFSLTDALGAKDKKLLWTLYQKALSHNVSPEEVHGILFWQIKSLLTAYESKSAQEAGMKPFVYSKAKGYLKNYSETELKILSSKLVSLFHDSRRGGPDLNEALEGFILEI